jgi:hypothetical protein
VASSYQRESHPNSVQQQKRGRNYSKRSKKKDLVFQPQLSLLCFRAVILLRHCIFFATGVSFLRSGENPILRRPGAGLEPGTLQIHPMKGHS